MTAISRMQREVRMLASDPPPGIYAAPKEDKLTELEAQIQGPTDSVYEGGVFRLSVDIPTRYPIEPPKVRFLTRVYHPNIDPEGRICLDILNPPPKGAWKPSLNVSTVLASIGLLLGNPNPDDGLVAETSQEFKHQRSVFDAKARAWTRRYAMADQHEQEAATTAQTAAEEGENREPVAVAGPSASTELHNKQTGEDVTTLGGDKVLDQETGAGGTRPEKRVLSPMKHNSNVETEGLQQLKSSTDNVPQKKSKLSLYK